MTADPRPARPAPPEHADRDDHVAISNIVWLNAGFGHSSVCADKILAWMKSEGFARTPESASAEVTMFQDSAMRNFRELESGLPDNQLHFASAGSASGPAGLMPESGPIAWAVYDGNNVFYRVTREWGAAKNDTRMGTGSRPAPFTVYPLYLHPAPPPSVGATPSPEGGT